jgi:hypothetical protein
MAVASAVCPRAAPYPANRGQRIEAVVNAHGGLTEWDAHRLNELGVGIEIAFVVGVVEQCGGQQVGGFR